MISVLLLTGAAIIAVGAIAKYWNGIKDWLIRGIKKVQEIIDGVVYGVKVFAKKLKEAFKEISRHYSQNKQGQWTETTVSREISASEVPAEIRNKAPLNREKDLTQELELVVN